MANYDSGARFDDPNVHYDEPSAPLKNMNQNLISSTLTAQAVTDILAAVATIRTKLPFLISLSPEERKRLANITEESQGVVLAALNFAAQHPEAIPATFNLAEFNKDGALLSPLQQVTSAISQLDRDADDTLRALHSDLYGEFLDIYAFAKATNRNGGYDEFINSVKGRFARGPRKKANPTPPTQ
jgi:hypothetical protein